MLADAARQWGGEHSTLRMRSSAFNARDIVKPFESEINARGFHVYLHLPVGVWADAGLAGKAI